MNKMNLFDHIDDLSYEDRSLEEADFLESYDGDQDLFEDYYSDQMASGMTSDQTITELFTYCLLPTLRDAILHFILPILIANFVSLLLIKSMQFSVSFRTFQDGLERLVTIVTGFLLLRHHYQQEYYPQLVFLTAVIILAGFSVPFLIQLSRRESGSATAHLWLLWCQHLAIIGICETFVVVRGPEWNKLRPNLMLILMKSISYYHETIVAIGKKEAGPEFLDCFTDFFAYLFHPCTIILGVWHPHTKHSDLFVDAKRSNESNNIILQRILCSMVSLALSLTFLLCSTCLIDYLINHIVFEYLDFIAGVFVDTDSCSVWLVATKFLRAYSTAIQFHYSHYFICFLGQSMFDLWDIRLTVTKPLDIEWPRSLVDVVVAWNIPMHKWLKRYVFQTLKKRFNIYLTILATYFISSYLHGFNFQIWSVLLTLGLITQAEFKLRKCLAGTLSACVESRPCTYDYYIADNDDDSLVKNCRAGHERTEDFLSVRWMNLGFTFMALSNLAFLGATFDGDPKSSLIMNVWTVWKDLHFYSYISMAVMFSLYKTLTWTNNNINAHDN